MPESKSSSSKTVGEIDLKEAIQVAPQSNVIEACKVMTSKNVDCVIVVDSSGSFGAKPDFLTRPEIMGILTVKDVVNRVIATGKNPEKTKVSDVMTSHVQTVEATATLYKIAMTMNQNNFRQIPVLDKYDIKGIATSRSINMSILHDIIEDIKLIATIFR